MRNFWNWFTVAGKPRLIFGAMMLAAMLAVAAPTSAGMNFAYDASGNPTINSTVGETGTVTLGTTNGNLVDTVLVATGVASSVNQVTVTSAATTTAPTIKATGGDTNIGLTVAGKGTGTTTVGVSTGTTALLGTVTPNLSLKTNVLSGDVTMTTASTYYDGPSMAQGTSGTWFASGSVVITATAGDTLKCKLWDGTTVISSSGTVIGTAEVTAEQALSGYLASPAGNIKISCTDTTTGTTPKIVFNFSGNSSDGNIWGIRVA